MQFLIKSIDGREFSLTMDNDSSVLDLKMQIKHYYTKALSDKSTIENTDDIKLLYRAKALKNDIKLSQIFNTTEFEPHKVNLVIPKRHKKMRHIAKDINEFFKDELVNDLNQVGITKALGYLTIDDLEEGGYNIELLKNSFFKKGIDIHMNNTKFFYAYHKPSLQSFLDNNRSCLELNGWPLDANLFVRKVGSETAKNPELWQLIHRAFTDPTSIVTVENKTTSISILIESQTKDGIWKAPMPRSTEDNLKENHGNSYSQIH